MSDEQKPDNERAHEDLLLGDPLDQKTGEIHGAQLTSLRESAKQGVPLFSSGEDSTKSIERDSLQKILKAEAQENSPRFGILKHARARNNTRLSRLAESSSSAEVCEDEPPSAPLTEEKDDPTTAVPQELLEQLKGSVGRAMCAPDEASVLAILQEDSTPVEAPVPQNTQEPVVESQEDVSNLVTHEHIQDVLPEDGYAIPPSHGTLLFRLKPFVFLLILFTVLVFTLAFVWESLVG